MRVIRVNDVTNYKRNGNCPERTTQVRTEENLRYNHWRRQVQILRRRSFKEGVSELVTKSSRELSKLRK